MKFKGGGGKKLTIRNYLTELASGIAQSQRQRESQHRDHLNATLVSSLTAKPSDRLDSFTAFGDSLQKILEHSPHNGFSI